MHYFLVYILSMLLGVGLIMYGNRGNKRLEKYTGIFIVSLNVLVPVLGFIAGVIDGFKS